MLMNMNDEVNPITLTRRANASNFGEYKGMNENHVLFRLMLAVKVPRVARTRVYELPQILFCAVVAMLSGAMTFTEMELVTRTRRKWIEKWIALPGIPSHDTFNRVLQLIPLLVPKGHRLSPRSPCGNHPCPKPPQRHLPIQIPERTLRP